MWFRCQITWNYLAHLPRPFIMFVRVSVSPLPHTYFLTDTLSLTVDRNYFKTHTAARSPFLRQAAWPKHVKERGGGGNIPVTQLTNSGGNAAAAKTGMPNNEPYCSIMYLQTLWEEVVWQYIYHQLDLLIFYLLALQCWDAIIYSFIITWIPWNISSSSDWLCYFERQLISVSTAYLHLQEKK